MMCPRCSANLQAAVRNKIEIDHCPACGGVWLDKGELEKFVSYTRNFTSKEDVSAHEQYGERKYFPSHEAESQRRKGRNDNLDEMFNFEK